MAVGRSGGETVFDFQLGRGREGPAKFLQGWNGILQSDGYPSYDQTDGPGMVRVGCWAHARRKFVNAVKVNPRIPMPRPWYWGLEVGERGTLRRERALPLLDEIRKVCWQLQTPVPSRVLGQAATYTLNQWDRLARRLE